MCFVQISTFILGYYYCCCCSYFFLLVLSAGLLFSYCIGTVKVKKIVRYKLLLANGNRNIIIVITIYILLASFLCFSFEDDDYGG